MNSRTFAPFILLLIAAAALAGFKTLCGLLGLASVTGFVLAGRDLYLRIVQPDKPGIFFISTPENPVPIPAYLIALFACAMFAAACLPVALGSPYWVLDHVFALWG